MTTDAGPDAGVATCPEGEHLARTRQGCLRGAMSGAVESFKGIPYTAPPVGTLRWRPPAPAPLHEGVADAIEFGPACPQKPDTFSGETREWSEDCLTLNVWTPNTGATGDAALPVMVWFHPGGLYEGGSDTWTYDGRYLAERGQVVVVTINYRLGQLGYLAHPELSAEDPNGVSGNYGLLDQVAALRWVRDNIEFFGGDADNVTLFGTSGGGISVCALLVTPLSEGLFDRAIIQSVTCPGYKDYQRNLKEGTTLAPESAEEQGERFSDALGCSTGDVLGCMRAKPVDEILDALGSTGVIREETFGLTVDGRVLEGGVRETVLEGMAHDVPVIVGGDADEGSFLVAGGNLTVEQYEALVRATYDRADELLDLYPASDFATPNAAFASLLGDVGVLCPNLEVLRALAGENANTYSYVFGHVTALGMYLGLGAYHGIDMEFSFGSLRLRPEGNPAATEAELAISNAMVSYWSTFARTGDPNGTGTVEWPRFNSGDEPYLHIASPIEVRERLKPEKCDLINALP